MKRGILGFCLCLGLASPAISSPGPLLYATQNAGLETGSLLILSETNAPLAGVGSFGMPALMFDLAYDSQYDILRASGRDPAIFITRGLARAFGEHFRAVTVSRMCVQTKPLSARPPDRFLRWGDPRTRIAIAPFAPQAILSSHSGPLLDNFDGAPGLTEMPLGLTGRTKDAVVAVPASSDWQAGVERFLLTLGIERSRVQQHLTILEQRHNGRLRWFNVLADATLPDGRPMPVSRRYAEMLVTELHLPLYDIDSLRLSLDLHNPNNEARVPEYDLTQLELALVADVRFFSALAPGSIFPSEIGFEEQARRRAANGALLGELLARLFEAVQGTFAYADISSTGWVVAASQNPTSVVHPAPAGVRPVDFLWSISAWSSALLGEELRRRIEQLSFTQKMLERIDPVHRPHYRIARRPLTGDGLFLQYRFLFGSESRGERAAIDTPLAKAAGLRSTNLLFRS